MDVCWHAGDRRAPTVLQLRKGRRRRARPSTKLGGSWRVQFRRATLRRSRCSRWRARQAAASRRRLRRAQWMRSTSQGGGRRRQRLRSSARSMTCSSAAYDGQTTLRCDERRELSVSTLSVSECERMHTRASLPLPSWSRLPAVCAYTGSSQCVSMYAPSRTRMPHVAAWDASCRTWPQLMRARGALTALLLASRRRSLSIRRKPL